MVIVAKAALDAICKDPRYQNELPAEAGMSLVVPVRREGKRYWTVFFYPVFGVLGDRSYGPPRWRADVDAATGAVTFSHVEPTEFGFAADKDARLGRAEDSVDLSRDYLEYEKDVERYYRFIDDVASCADDPRRSISGIEAVKIEMLRNAFRRVAFRPMLPVYRRLDGGFFDWLLDSPPQ